MAHALMACAPVPTPISTLSATEAALSSPTVRLPLSTPTSKLAEATEIIEAVSFFPPAAIEILAPIGQKNHSSPLQLILRIHSSIRSPLNITLIGSDGRLLARNILPMNQNQAQEFIEQKLHFEISDMDESARLIISSEDEFGRLFALSSITVNLQSQAAEKAQMEPFTQFDEKIWIQFPSNASIIESGQFKISGLVLPSSQRPLLVQLSTREGKVLAFGEIYPDQVDGQLYSSFEFIFELILDEEQWLQLGILESGQEIAGDLHFSSIEFQLVPQVEGIDQN